MDSVSLLVTGDLPHTTKVSSSAKKGHHYGENILRSSGRHFRETPEVELVMGEGL